MYIKKSKTTLFIRILICILVSETHRENNVKKQRKKKKTDKRTNKQQVLVPGTSLLLMIRQSMLEIGNIHYHAAGEREHAMHDTCMTHDNYKICCCCSCCSAVRPLTVTVKAIITDNNTMTTPRAPEAMHAAAQ